ncbi:hypothetical protein CEXT_577931 [Caerostris extrusa]|uniref:Uncharacterized protein n=1 Tax=Caerostris extrusa TaxID=172846 RepID=A0AAV4WLA5_CAEEX|nr:hypothetical protein CEXT_577931 [Caerostris extrusa]
MSKHAAKPCINIISVMSAEKAPDNDIDDALNISDCGNWGSSPGGALADCPDVLNEQEGTPLVTVPTPLSGKAIPAFTTHLNVLITAPAVFGTCSWV